MTAREWLRANDYSDVATMIDESLPSGGPVATGNGATGGKCSPPHRSGKCVKVSNRATRNRRCEKAPPVRLSNRWPQPRLF